ncbi:uncharacterized protein LOC135389306 [Ornithodoros turicata]|uniref:uncharacterized protein LOC135389306 n=1 Tax=Ornithodoros turicata TaxID=34597 RepID=UPI003138836B
MCLKLQRAAMLQHKCTLIFDGGSQRTFITRHLSQAPACQIVRTEHISIGAFGVQHKRPEVLEAVELSLRTTHGRGEHQKITALVVEQICSQVLEVPPDVIKERMQQYKLAITDCRDGALRQQIEILIGANNYWEFVTGRTLPVHQGVQAVETTLGLTLQGPCSLPNAVRTASCHTVAVLYVSQHREAVNDMMERIWNLDSIGIRCDKTDEAQHHFVLDNFKTSIQLKNDRYSVAFPWKPVVSMQDNKHIAEQRLSQVTRRLTKSQGLMARYDAAIRENLVSGVAEKVTQEMDQAQDTAHIYYMPHHTVIREDRMTTKMRIVYDASSHEPITRSLNDNLNAGPNLNPGITPLMNFRLYPVALISDVQKALLQIAIHEDDRGALRFLWYRTTPVDGKPLPNVETWRMTRVTFGTALARSSWQQRYTTTSSCMPANIRD